MVRVAGLLELDEADVAVRSADGMTASQALTRSASASTSSARGRRGSGGETCGRRSPPPGSRSRRSTTAPRRSCKLEAYFEREIYPVLTPLAVGPGQPFPYISGLSLSLGVLAVDPDTGEERFARVKVPEGFDRFVPVGKRLVPLEAVIAHFLPMLFPGMEIAERALFRVTRDADFELSDDADDLLEAVESELRRRRFGDVVRLEVSASASRALRERLVAGLGVRPDQVYDVEGSSTRPTSGSSSRSTGPT